MKPRERGDKVGADRPLRLRHETREPLKSGIELLRRARPVQGLNARAPHRQRRAQPARTPTPGPPRDEVPAQGPRHPAGEFVGVRPDVRPERRPRKGARDQRVTGRGNPDSGAEGAEGGAEGAVCRIRRLHDVEQTHASSVRPGSPRPRRPRTKRGDFRGERVDDSNVHPDGAPLSQGRRDQDREEVAQQRRGRVVRLVVRRPSRPVVFLVFVRVGDVVEDVAPLARAPGVGGGVRHPGIGIVVENPGIRPVKAGLDGAVIPHHLQGELPPSGAAAAAAASLSSSSSSSPPERRSRRALDRGQGGAIRARSRRVEAAAAAATPSATSASRPVSARPERRTVESRRVASNVAAGSPASRTTAAHSPTRPPPPVASNRTHAVRAPAGTAAPRRHRTRPKTPPPPASG